MVIRRGIEPLSTGWKPVDLTDSRTDHYILKMSEITSFISDLSLPYSPYPYND